MDWLVTAAMSAVADAWSAYASLSNDTGRLRTTLPRVHVLIDQANQWQFTNPGVADLLVQLKDASYDADDLLDELAAQEHQTSDKPLSSVRLILCELITGMAQKVRDIQARLDLVSSELERTIRVLGMHHNPLVSHAFRETSSSLGDSVVFGRDREIEEVVRLLLNSANPCQPNCSSVKRRKKYDVVAVLPVVGIGGVGKTTLAQIVYNDSRVEDHFHLRMWVCMPESLDLDVKRVTREIIESATMGALPQSGLANLDALQGNAKDLVMSRRFLLVIDNAWIEDVREWQRLFAPLKYGLPGSVILVTTRSRNVADAIGTMDLISLSGLPDEAYWDLFRQYAFGMQDMAHHPELEIIGKKIISMLKGSPLAAKTVCGMLRLDMSVAHWRAIMNSELWELEQQGEGDILPVLRLSYQYLPAHLKQCFTFCSIFPKGYAFRKETLIDMWIAEGFITAHDGIGDRCWQEFLNRCFFQKYMFSDVNCVMHDLMCDLARSVSISECFQLDSEKWQQKIPHTVRHLSVCTKYLDPSNFMEIGRYKKLRSLVIFGLSEQDLSFSLNNLFDMLTNIRLLVLRNCTITELPESIGNLKNLRYLDISSAKIQILLPESVFQLSNLQVLNIRNIPLEDNPKGISRLTNLRKCYMDAPITSVIANLSNLTSLRNSVLFEVPKGKGHRISELKDMTQLSEVLHIKSLENVVKQDYAAQAMLNRKEHLKKLILEWSSNRHKDAEFSSTKSFTDNMVLELLQPHPNIEHLKVMTYGGTKSPSWLQSKMLNCLQELWFSRCPYLMTITSLPSALEILHIEDCATLISLEECLQTDVLKRIKEIRITSCAKLASLPVERFHGFSSLSSLSVVNCPELLRTRKLALPPSTESLLLRSCGYLDESLPDCLCDLPSLAHLALYNCPNIRCLPKQIVSRLSTLKVIFFNNCDGLQSLNGLHYLSQLVSLHIVNCARLTDLGLPMASEIGEWQCMQKLEDLSISDTSLLQVLMSNPLPSLRTLVICQSSDSVILQGVHKLSHCFPLLEELIIHDCRNLQELPEELHSLSSLQFLRICNCPKIQSLPLKGLPSSLERLTFENCHPMLVEQLKKLEISYNTGLPL